MEQGNLNTGQQNEIALRDLIFKLREWFKYILSKWKILLLGAGIGALLGLGLSLIMKKKYSAELTFVVQDNKSNGLGTYIGMASQLGLDLGMGSGSGIFSGDNVMQFLKSRLIIEKSLLTNIDYNGKRITLADLYLDFNGYKEKWINNPELNSIHFNVNKPRYNFSVKEDSILNLFQQEIRDNALEISKPDAKMGFISVKCVSTNEMFAKVFTERLVDEATAFYVDSKTKQSRVNVDKLQKIADSLELQLNRKTYSVAANQDINQNPAKLVSSVQNQVLTRDKVVLETMFGEVVKNLELSKISMAQETPAITIVDQPIYPLDEKKFRKLLGLILGGFLGGFIVLIVIIFEKIFKEIMEPQA